MKLKLLVGVTGVVNIVVFEVVGVCIAVGLVCVCFVGRNGGCRCFFVVFEDCHW